MNEEQTRICQELRHAGYAVIIWTPEELRDANPRKVEDRSIELGWDVISDLASPMSEERISEQIRNIYRNSGCEKSDLDEAVTSMLDECDNLFEDEEAAVKFLMEPIPGTSIDLADDDKFQCVHCGNVYDNDDSHQWDVGLVCTLCHDGDPGTVQAAIDDWKMEVQNGDTKLGFAEWMLHQREANDRMDNLE